jgi:hypothetical protein
MDPAMRCYLVAHDRFPPVAPSVIGEQEQVARGEWDAFRHLCGCLGQAFHGGGCGVLLCR